MTNQCKQCGYPLKGSETTCPECGCSIETTSSINTTSSILITNDNWNYNQYRTGIFRQWYFKNSNNNESDSYDTLNDFLLLFNLIFRMIWSMFWPIALICLFTWIILITLTSDSAFMTSDNVMFMQIAQFAVIIGCIILFFVKLIPNAIYKYWVPFHRTWRRLNKRYWINIHRAIETNSINVIK